LIKYNIKKDITWVHSERRSIASGALDFTPKSVKFKIEYLSY